VGCVRGLISNKKIKKRHILTKATKRPVGMDIHTRLRSSTTERHYEELKKKYLFKKKEEIN
jgi:hypothetical protein